MSTHGQACHQWASLKGPGFCSADPCDPHLSVCAGPFSRLVSFPEGPSGAAWGVDPLQTSVGGAVGLTIQENFLRMLFSIRDLCPRLWPYPQELSKASLGQG